MRTILLMRHASARESQSDHERPLSRRGVSESVRIGEWIQRCGHSPQTVISSTAVRAVSTAQGVVSALDPPPPVELDPALYLASRGQILDCISSLDDACESLLLVVHNPGAAELAAWLLGSTTPDAEQRVGAGFEPGAVAVFTLDRQHWTEIVAHAGTLVNFATPNQIRS